MERAEFVKLLKIVHYAASYSEVTLDETTAPLLAKTFRTPDFEVGWHQHVEYELILFTEGPV